MVRTRMIPGAAEAYDGPLLIKSLLAVPENYEPGREIVYRDLVRYDYTELGRRVRRLANALVGLGVRPGDTVAVLDWDSHRYFECFFAVPMIGAVLHMVNVRLSPEQMLYTMNHAEDAVVLVHRDFLPVLESLSGRLETVQSYVLLRDAPGEPDTRLALAGEYEQLLAGAPADYDFPDFDERSVATTFYTTGTTGDPKGVFFTHRQLVLHTLALVAASAGIGPTARFRSTDVYMPITPMFHVHAWGFPYAATVLGAKQVFPGRYEPQMLLRLLVREKVTFSHCVPTILHMLLSCPDAVGVDFSGWKMIIGGSALPKGLARTALERGIDICTGYGMSETCPLLTLSYLNAEQRAAPIDEQIELRVKTGVPMPLVQLLVAGEEGDELPRDGRSVGEIIVRSPWLTQGYTKNEHASEALWRGGWLHTGDVAVRDEQGRVQITDRLKDVIKSGGEWVSSLAVEDLLSQHEAVSEVAVVGVPDTEWGERPAALIVLKEAHLGKAAAEDFRGFLRKFVETGVIHRWAIPDRIELTQAIPKTSVGKIDKKQIRANLTR